MQEQTVRPFISKYYTLPKQISNRIWKTEVTQRDQDMIFTHENHFCNSVCVLVESLRYCCLFVFLLVWWWLFDTVLFHFTSLKTLSRSLSNRHAIQHLHTHLSKSPECICSCFHAHNHTHTQTHNEKEVLMSNYCHNERVTSWIKLDLQDFNISDGKLNKLILLWTTTQHLEDFYILEIHCFYWSPAWDTQILPYFNSFKKGEKMCADKPV